MTTAGAEVYCFMRSNGMDHQSSWEAAYAVIRKKTGGIFATSPEHAALLITEAVVNDPGRFPPNSVNYLTDLFRGSIGPANSLNSVLNSTDSSDINSFNSTNSSVDDKLISAGENAVMFGNQGIYDVFNPAHPDRNSVVDHIENTIGQQPTPNYLINKVATNDVNSSWESDVLTNFNSTDTDLSFSNPGFLSISALGGPMEAEKPQVTPSGLKITDLMAGTGEVASSGQNVEVHYRGMLEDGTQIDASYDRGTTFTFPLGAGRVISGWEEGIQGMKVGGKRTLEIPPDLGYGARGAGGVILPNATLIFEVELNAVDGNRNVSSSVTIDTMFDTYDPITNPNQGLECSGPEFGDVGFEFLSIDSTNEADFTTIEYLQGLVAGGGYDSIDSMNESLLDPLKSIFEVADILMF